MTEFVKPVSSKGLSVEDVCITPEEMEMYLDLEPFVNPSPYIVPEDMSLTKVAKAELRNFTLNSQSIPDYIFVILQGLQPFPAAWS